MPLRAAGSDLSRSRLLWFRTCLQPMRYRGHKSPWNRTEIASRLHLRFGVAARAWEKSPLWEYERTTKRKKRAFRFLFQSQSATFIPKDGYYTATMAAVKTIYSGMCLWIWKGIAQFSLRKVVLKTRNFTYSVLHRHPKLRSYLHVVSWTSWYMLRNSEIIRICMGKIRFEFERRIRNDIWTKMAYLNFFSCLFVSWVVFGSPQYTL